MLKDTSPAIGQPWRSSLAHRTCLRQLLFIFHGCCGRWLLLDPDQGPHMRCTCSPRDRGCTLGTRGCGQFASRDRGCTVGMRGCIRDDGIVATVGATCNGREQPDLTALQSNGIRESANVRPCVLFFGEALPARRMTLITTSTPVYAVCMCFTRAGNLLRNRGCPVRQNGNRA